MRWRRNRLCIQHGAIIPSAAGTLPPSWEKVPEAAAAKSGSAVPSPSGRRCPEGADEGTSEAWQSLSASVASPRTLTPTPLPTGEGLHVERGKRSLGYTVDGASNAHHHLVFSCRCLGFSSPTPRTFPCQLFACVSPAPTTTRVPLPICCKASKASSTWKKWTT
ncbi:hypothetical protein XHV734_3189 [Xanthomonas hortorum pv. vitians]|nr:hypothetical protein XHV734_3189 [Xanthomonas hortorum pv. vitians]